MEKCKFPDGISIRPDGIHELSACDFEFVDSFPDSKYFDRETMTLFENVTVEILRCRKCGVKSVGWYRQPNTKEIKVHET